MAIPASHIVQVNPRVLQPGATDLQINGLFLTESAIQPISSIVMQFSSATSVGDYYGTGSLEYGYAVKYFLGYDNSFTKPRRLMIGRRIKESAAAWLRGGRYDGTFAELKGISSGGMDISIDGKAVQLTELDFSDCNSHSDVANVIQTKIRQTSGLELVTVEYSSLTRAFQITSGTKGESSEIVFATPPSAEDNTDIDLSLTLKLTADKGAVISVGAVAMDVPTNMQAIRNISDNWVTFTTLYEAEDEEILDYAQWATGQGVDYLYLPWSSDIQLTQQGTETIAEILKDQSVAATSLQYFDTPELSVFIMGAAASIAWDRVNGAIAFAFKSQDGIAANVKDLATAIALEDRAVNYYGAFATRNDDFVFYNRGRLYGDYKFLDAYVNAVWFKNVVQAAVMQGMKTSPRVPYNEKGYTLIRSWLMDPITRAKNNGVLEAGVALSELQKSELAVEAGRDIAGELYSNGYVVQVEDAGAHVRVDRDSPNVSIWYTYGGSVQRVVVASTALL